jgi:hypothetical protein
MICLATFEGWQPGLSAVRKMDFLKYVVNKVGKPCDKSADGKSYKAVETNWDKASQFVD